MLKQPHPLTHPRTLVLCLLTSTLLACGGGGGGNDGGGGGNTAPSATAQSVTMNEDTVASITLTGTDLESDPLTFSISSDPSHGTLNGTVPNLSYIPTGDYHGSDSFEFVVNDGNSDSAPATVSITITPVDDAPSVTSAASVSVAENTTAVISLTATDPEGDSIAFSLSGAVDQGAFSLVGSDLSFIAAPDYEAPTDADMDNVYAVEIAATANGLSSTQTLSVTVTDVFDSPPSAPLNDTGLTWGGDYPSGNNSACTGETISAQDCSHGRDVTHNDNNDGYAGFSFTKLDASGNALPASATTWHCVQDNITGLIWEVKTDDGGLRDKGWTYPSYDSRYSDGDSAGWSQGNSSNTAGTDTVWAGPVDTGAGVGMDNCGNSSAICTTEQYVVDVNATNLCGANDWRMPSREELRSLVHYGRTSPAIDTDYFPNTVSSYVWSSSVSSDYSNAARYVYFERGYDGLRYRHSTAYVRLVRGGQ